MRWRCLLFVACCCFVFLVVLSWCFLDVAACGILVVVVFVRRCVLFVVYRCWSSSFMFGVFVCCCVFLFVAVVCGVSVVRCSLFVVCCRFVVVVVCCFGGGWCCVLCFVATAHVACRDCG